MRHQMDSGPWRSANETSIRSIVADVIGDMDLILQRGHISGDTKSDAGLQSLTAGDLDTDFGKIMLMKLAQDD